MEPMDTFDININKERELFEIRSAMVIMELEKMIEKGKKLEKHVIKLVEHEASEPPRKKIKFN